LNRRNSVHIERDATPNIKQANDIRAQSGKKDVGGTEGPDSCMKLSPLLPVEKYIAVQSVIGTILN
jgi:hypothetical protein